MLSAAAVTAGPEVAGAQTPARATTPSAAPSPDGGQLSPRLLAVAPPSVAAAGPAAADARARHAVDPPPQAPASGPGSLLRRPDGRYVVDVRMTDVSRPAQDRLQATGVSILSVDPDIDTITVAAAAGQLAAVAGVSGVIAVTEVLTPITNATCPTGIVSEGDAQLDASGARGTFGVDGSGVKVGIVSDSFNVLGGEANDVANGELPGPGNPCGFGDQVDVEHEESVDAVPPPTDEGRAMGQIVHDLAPGADLAFATADGGDSAMAANIRQLQANGAKVIVDDVTYPDEPMYQDGPIAKAVDDVRAAGTTYVSSAGNSNVTVNGHDVGSYEATAGYRPTTCPPAAQAQGSDCHNFNLSGTDADDTIAVPASGFVQVLLGWDEPVGGVTTDLDLLALRDDGTALPMGSTENNTITGRPTESFAFSNASSTPVNLHLVVRRNHGATPRFKLVLLGNVTAVEHNASVGSDVVGPTLFGHNGALAAETVGATSFASGTTAEAFSAKGPATYCWQPVGTGSGGGNPAAPISPCQTKNVDVTATDGVATSFFGFNVGGVNRFFGTSAAAPHAAAVAALQTQARACYSPAQFVQAQRSSATAITDPSSQGAVGSGLIDAVGAIQALAPCPATHFAVSMPSPNTRFFPVTATVTALDVGNRAATTYGGTVHFTSGDGAAQLPADTTLTNGVGTVSVTFGTLGAQTLVATDTHNASITGSGTSTVSNPAPVAPVPGLAKQPIVTGPTFANTDGRIEVFAVQADHSVRHIFQNSPGGPWSQWFGLGAASLTGRVQVATNPDGRLEVFGVGTDGQLWHTFQLCAGGCGWSQWFPLGGQWRPDHFSVAGNVDGRLEIFAVGTDGSLQHEFQNAPNSGWSGFFSLSPPWTPSPSATVPGVAAGRQADGRLVLATVDPSGRLLIDVQAAPGLFWAPWFTSASGGIAGPPALGRNADGRLEVFAAASSDQLWHAFQNSDTTWSSAFSLGGSVDPLANLAIASNQDGRMEAFGSMPSTHTLTHVFQSAPNSPFGGFGSLSASGTSLAETPNPDGRIELFILDLPVSHLFQVAPNQGWSSVFTL
jgi:hypothetical protein